MDTVPGLRVFTDYIDRSRERALLEAIDAGTWNTELRRRVQHYGYSYSYRSRTVCATIDVPDWAASVAAELVATGLSPQLADQVIVNEYLPGQGISPHIDRVDCFDTVIVSLSLGSSCVMEFSQRDTGRAASLFLAPRTLLVLCDEARYAWHHEIPARRSDLVDGAEIVRGRRVSVTFRKVLLASTGPRAAKAARKEQS